MSFYEKEVTVAIMDSSENIIGYLHPNYVEISETSELYTLRYVDIIHPLLDPTNEDISHYPKLLVEGNKIFRPATTDGEACLYVICGDKEVDYAEGNITIYAEEVARELGEYKILRNSAFSWIVTTTLINNTFGDLFTAGTVNGPSTPTTYSGALTPLAIIREIEKNTGGEFQFRYSWDSTKIKRELDFLTKIGKTHTRPIELGRNCKELNVRINESDVAIAAGPIGTPEDAASTFHESLKAFEDQVFATNTQVPLYVTADDEGNPVNGPMAYPPYPKAAGKNYVECNNSSELVANYQRIRSKAPNQSTSFPRIYPFETTEENKYNIYWECVQNIREHLKPEIEIGSTVVDILKLKGLESEYYNMGDIVYLIIPGYDDLIEARILKTVKDPRYPENDSIEVGNYKTTFMKEILGISTPVSADIDLK